MFLELGLGLLPRASTSNQSIIFGEVLVSIACGAREHKVTRLALPILVLRSFPLLQFDKVIRPYLRRPFLGLLW